MTGKRLDKYWNSIPSLSMRLPFVVYADTFRSVSLENGRSSTQGGAVMLFASILPVSYFLYAKEIGMAAFRNPDFISSLNQVTENLFPSNEKSARNSHFLFRAASSA